VQKHTVFQVGIGGGLHHMAKDHLVGRPEVMEVLAVDEGEALRVTLNDGQSDGSFIAEVLVKNGFKVKSLKEEEIDLEDVFMGITKGITN
jgi:ABC-2 type transport system ATP-binding protein